MANPRSGAGRPQGGAAQGKVAQGKAAASGGLARYRAKREFGKTPEPTGSRQRPERAPSRWDQLPKGHRFCVQLHRASRLHYDFRLEHRGVLLSWAVPKGPSMDPRQRRLALQVEDHPIAYGDFEDVIPSGYGAGTVLVWDTGSFAWEEGPKGKATEALRHGHLDFRLEGERLRGGFSLIRMDRSQRSDKPQWLLLKRRDGEAGADGRRPETSVKTGRTLDQVAEGRAAARPTHRDDQAGADAQRRRSSAKTGRTPGRMAAGRPAAEVKRQSPDGLGGLLSNAPRGAPPQRLSPMLATLADRPFSDPDWLFELKYDGVRCLLRRERGRIRLQGRSGRDETLRYPELQSTATGLAAPSVLLDGEVVALDEQGRPSFAKIQRRIQLKPKEAALAVESTPVVFMAFDLLFAKGHDLRRLPLRTRKQALRQLLSDGPQLRYADEVWEQGEALFQEVSRRQLEGVMAKRADSVYATGKRSRDWLKIKARRTQDCVICGYLPGQGRRQDLGALILGVYAEGRLEPAGKVGTGFSERLLSQLRRDLDRLSTDSPPWTTKNVGPRGAVWVSPRLVCEVEHAGWTATQRLRQPSFRVLRPDVPASACIRVAEVAATEVRSTPTAQPGLGLRPAARRAALAPARKQREELPARGGPLRVGDREVALTHLDKLLWPSDGIRKRDLVAYHLQMADHILPHLAGRAAVSQVFPEGVGKPGFWRRAVPAGAPAWLPRWQARPGEPTICPLIEEPAALVWLANQAALEIHPWHSRRDRPTQPDWAVFDLDPGPKAGWEEAVEVAQLVRRALEGLGLGAWLKTSGQSGLHIYLPLRRGPDQDQVREWVGQLAHQLAQQEPQLITETWAVKGRGGRVRIDYTQNVVGKTLAAVYSPRPSPGAPVSTPIEWDELESVDRSQLNLRVVPARVAELGDLFAPVLRDRQRLPRPPANPEGGHRSQLSTRRK